MLKLQTNRLQWGRLLRLLPATCFVWCSCSCGVCRRACSRGLRLLSLDDCPGSGGPPCHIFPCLLHGFPARRFTQSLHHRTGPSVAQPSTSLPCSLSPLAHVLADLARGPLAHTGFQVATAAHLQQAGSAPPFFSRTRVTFAAITALTCPVALPL